MTSSLGSVAAGEAGRGADSASSFDNCALDLVAEHVDAGLTELRLERGKQLALLLEDVFAENAFQHFGTGDEVLIGGRRGFESRKALPGKLVLLERLENRWFP